MATLPIKKAKPVGIGNSFYFTIPKQYVNNGVINPKGEYDLDIHIDDN